MDCSYRHRLKHIEKINMGKPSIHTEYGQVIHDVLENYILGKHELNDETIATATDAFQKLCGELKEKHNINVSDKDIKDFSASIPEIVNSVPAFLDETFPGWTGFAAEHALYESVAGQTNKWFKGFIDTVIRIPKNSRKGKKTSAPEDNEGATVMRLSELVKQVKPGEENQEFGDGYEFCRSLPHKCGVVGIPNVVFYDRAHQHEGRHLVRFAFCKQYEMIDDAVSRLKAMS
jgi:hypothetical protein